MPNLQYGQSTVAIVLDNDVAITPTNVCLRRLIADSTAVKFVIPSETLNKSSPFYGMIYKNEYGLPLRGEFIRTRSKND